jgi:hypothetical protein
LRGIEPLYGVGKTRVLVVVQVFLRLGPVIVPHAGGAGAANSVPAAR